MVASMQIDSLIDELIGREGGYVDHPADRGGPTRWGITQQVALAYGYAGDMHELPRETAEAIYRERYWSGPGFAQVAARAPAIANELLDTGVNMGPGTATRFLQRALNVLNRRASAYPDIAVDGALGRMTLLALDMLLERRGADGERVLLGMLNAQQSVRYIELAERDPTQEEFQFGWQLQRVAMP